MHTLIATNVRDFINNIFLVSREELDSVENVHPSFLEKSRIKKNAINSSAKTASSALPPCAATGSGSGSSTSKTSSTSSSTPSAASSASSSSGCSCTSSFPPESPDAPQPEDSSSSDSPCIEDDEDPHKESSSKNSSGSSSSSSKSSSSGGDGTKACGDPKSTNATGKIGPNSLAITKPPYKVISCDQILIIEGTTFASTRDYSVRKNQVFSLSLYMLNSFNSKDPKTLSNHMLLEDMSNLPTSIYGAPTCISFDNLKTNNKIVMCLPARGYVEQIKQAIMKFMKCRIGFIGKNIKPKDIRKVFEATCKGKKLDSTDNADQVYAMMKSLMPDNDNKDNTPFKTNPYYSTTHVPGTKNPPKKDYLNKYAAIKEKDSENDDDEK